MRLLRCNIVNYGCLHNFSYEFQSGINLISESNGWGKSTLSSFLCTMLYGLDSTTKRNIRENDRKHYHPWQEGPFGGSLEFEISGRQYRAERFFGLRERDDTFVLYDLKTMSPSQDYTSQLGTELFGIDKTGYLHSTFVPQGQPAPEYNNTLAARLARLSQSRDDINQYETAVAEIDKALRFYVKTGKRGEIAILQQEADTTEQLLQEALSATQQFSQVHSELTVLECQKKQLGNRLIAIQQQIHSCTEQEIYARYNLLKSQLNQKEHSLEEIEDFFHDQLPDDGDIEAYLLSCTNLSRLEQQERQKALSAFQMQEYTFLQSFFHSNEDLPDPMEKHLYPASAFNDEELIFSGTQQRLLMESKFYQTESAFLFPSEYTSTEYFLSTEDLPDSETIGCARELYYQYRSHLADQQKASDLTNSIKEQIHETELSLDQENQIPSDFPKQFGKKSSHPTGKHAFFLQLPVAVFLIAAGLLICCLGTPVVGLPISLLGIILALYICFLHKKSCPMPFNNELQLQNEICARLQKQLSYLQSQLDLQQEYLAASQTAAKNCHKQLTAISKELHLPCEDSRQFTDTYLALLAQLDNQLKSYQQKQQREYILYKKQLDFYNQLKRKYEDYNLTLQKQQYCKQQIDDLRQNIIQFLQPYFPSLETCTPSSLELKLHELKNKLNTYRSLLSDMRLASQNLNLFFQEHPDFQDSDNKLAVQHPSTEILSSAKSLTVLQSEESVIREQYANCIQQISNLQVHMEQLQEKAEQYCILEEKHIRLKQQIEEYKERHRILSLTKQYLSKARHDFTDNYLHSIERNFNHYAQLLEKNELLHANMNSDFHMVISDHGALRDTGWYSQGTRDLIDFCSRLAIIEDLFTDEPPFLVLDDPFVNLDDNSLQKLSFILKKVAEKWQILYFTCHSSRNIVTSQPDS